MPDASSNTARSVTVLSFSSTPASIFDMSRDVVDDLQQVPAARIDVVE